MNRHMCTALVRGGLRTVAVGVTAAVVAASVGGPAPSSVRTPRLVTIPVSLVGVTTALGPAGIVESPTTVGVADSALYTQSPEVVEKTLDELAALGVTDIRVAVPWVYIESTQDEYDWSQMDLVVREANERGIDVVGVITATPSWAGFPLNGHSDPADYAQFAAHVADRYDAVLDEGEEQTYGKISAYEIWNEPNGFLFYNPVSAEAYTDMLKAAAPEIRAADPDATVIAGVLGAVRTIPGLSLNPVTFVEQMYASGAGTDCPGGCFDALSYHPYHYTLPFSRGADQVDSPINQVEAIRALMAAHGDEVKKIWATEYGLPTNGVVDEQEQADLIRDFVVAWQQVDGAGPVFVYSTRDANTGGFDDEENFGLFRTDWTEKQAVDMLRALYADINEDGDLDDTFQAPPENTSFLDQLILLGRQVSALLLIVPRAVVQLVVSVATAVAQAIGSLLGVPGAAPDMVASVRTSDDAADLDGQDTVTDDDASPVSVTTVAEQDDAEATDPGKERASVLGGAPAEVEAADVEDGAVAEDRAETEDPDQTGDPSPTAPEEAAGDDASDAAPIRAPVEPRGDGGADDQDVDEPQAGDDDDLGADQSATSEGPDTEGLTG